MKVLFVISEAYPFAKAGGLGDVGGSLPAALANTKTDVDVMMPKYGLIAESLLQNLEVIDQITVELGWRRAPCRIEKIQYQGINYYLIDNAHYFGRENLYGYEDDGERFAYFAKAVLASLPHLGYRTDILHCHDWHTALVPLFLKESYGNNPFYYHMNTVLTIHNLKYQGIFPPSYFDDVLGLAGHSAAWGKLEFYGNVNYLKAGLLSSDIITTVSPTYAKEIQDPYYGEKLDGVLRLRKDRLYGILNGIDIIKYNPETDPYLKVNYRSSLNKKEENKKDLQEILHLDGREKDPLVAIVSRLVDQKGLDLLAYIMEEMLSINLKVVVLGTGDQRYEDMFHYFALKYPSKMAFRSVFDDALAHKIYSGADMLLMPSRFEPCGLSQMIAMRYGTIPIVRETGGLRDTVVPYNQFTGEGNGFSFSNYNAHELLFTVQRAVRLFNEDKAAWKGLVNKALNSNFNWNNSAGQYQNLYQSLRV